ncbi:hypothetical protein D1007_55134 [Hordeum vulgare]|nr:hypothetical protein D1007_55134 [Hordeum vulgare]
MNSSLRKLRGFTLQRHEQRVDRHRDHSTAAKAVDEPLAAAQDMAHMWNYYDNLLVVAAAIANSSYALQEMGTCLLKRVTPTKDGINDKVLLLLGKSQFELRKLVDSYRVHVLTTITTPSQSLLNEHQTVELYLFKKGVKSLEAVEPHVRLAAKQQHIDHQFSALEDEDYFVEDKNDDDYNDSHDGELSFDYG